MASNEPSVDRAFAHVVWAAHILSNLSGKHQSLGYTSEPDLDDDDDNDNRDENEDESIVGADVKSDVNDELVPYAETPREKSLDCIAELLSPQKGWNYVTATALREHEDFVEVDIARNSGIEDNEDKEYLVLLEKFMASHHEANVRSKSEHGVTCLSFFNQTIKAQSNRIDQWALEAKNIWKKVTPTSLSQLACGGPVIESHDQQCVLDFQRDESGEIPQALYQFIKTLLSPSKESNDRRRELVLLAYACVASRTLQGFLSQCMAKSKAAKALKTLRLLARPVINVQILARVALMLSNFQCLRFYVATPLAATQISRTYVVSFREAWDQLGLPQLQGISNLTSMTDSVFKERCSRELSSHSEVQLMQRYEENPHLTPSIDYIGCSKKVCLLCESYLRLSLWRPRFRGKHGCCYPQWGIPPTTAKHQITRLNKLCEILKSKIVRLLKYNKPMVNSVAQSSIVSALDTLDIQSMDERATLRQAAEIKRQDLRERLAILNDPRSRGPKKILYTDLESLCVMCQWPCAQYCNVCRSCKYCSRRCQSIDWPTHKLLCSQYARHVPSRPSPNHQLGIWFRRDDDRPRLVWVSSPSGVESSICQSFDSFLGAHHGVYHTLPFSVNQRRSLDLDHTLTLCYHDWDDDLNRSISAIAAIDGSCIPHRWSGHVIAVSGQPHGKSYADVTLADFRHILDYFTTYWDDTIQQNPRSNSIGGLQVNCHAEQLLRGVGTFLPITVSPNYPHIGLKSELSKALGIPVELIRIEDQESGSAESSTAKYAHIPPHLDDPDEVLEESLSKNQNPYYRALLLCADDSSEKWGTPDLEWQTDESFAGSFILLRDDRQDLDLADAECLCRYATEILWPLLEKSMAEGSTVTRRDVLKMVTPVKMAEFRRKCSPNSSV